VHPALEAAVELAAHGLSVAVLNARFVKPLDSARIVALARRCRALLTVEEHSGMGGFGGAVLEALAAAGAALPVRCLALPDQLVEHGDPAAQKHAFGLDAEGIARAVQALLAETRS
jgi:1-deoxy-D-xylulose-5-phosphate synthase